jgi:hypothetical protein
MPQTILIESYKTKGQDDDSIIYCEGTYRIGKTSKHFSRIEIKKSRFGVTDAFIDKDPTDGDAEIYEKVSG